MEKQANTNMERTSVSARVVFEQSKIQEASWFTSTLDPVWENLPAGALWHIATFLSAATRNPISSGCLAAAATAATYELERACEIHQAMDELGYTEESLAKAIEQDPMYNPAVYTT